MFRYKSKKAEEPKPPEVYDARWEVHLKCACPKCKRWVDLADAPHFWDNNHDLKPTETDTKQTAALEVECPKCRHEFVVKCIK